MVRHPSLVLCLLSLVLAGCAKVDDGFVVEGGCPAISRDGRKLAFQRVEGTRMHLGVLDLASGRIEWVVRGETAATAKENACHPAWGPDGALVFSYANPTNTAYQRFGGKGPKDGYRLRLWKDGRTTDLVGGLARNYSPSFAPDGETVWFCRQTQTFRGIAKLSVAAPEKVEEVVHDLLPDAGVSQPVVSPDGRFLAYAELGKKLWGLKIVPTDNPLEQRSVTAESQAAYAPNWTPDGRYLVYTGFAKGDPGWGVCILNVEDLSWKRLCAGTDPCVSPDGRWIYYERDDKVWRRPLAPVDYPVAATKPIDPRAMKEKVILSMPGVATNRVSKGLSFPTDGLPTNVTYFVRFTFDWDARHQNASIMCTCVEGAGSCMAFLLNRCALLVLGDGAGMACAVPYGRKIGPGQHDVTVVHGADGVISCSVDGGPWSARRGTCKTGPVNGKGMVSVTGDATLKISDVEFGLGWPKQRAKVPE